MSEASDILQMSIERLVSKLEAGELQLPEMQRQYVWKSTQVRDLLDSLYRGYPSGSILIWEPEDNIVTRKASVKQPTNQQNAQLLLDGQQRLTSLAAIIRGNSVMRQRGSKRYTKILFNLNHPENLNKTTEDIDNEDMADASDEELRKHYKNLAFLVYSKKIASEPYWIDVSEVFRNDYSVFLKRAGIESFNDPNYNKFLKRLNRLRGIVEYYKYPVYVLSKKLLYEEVTEIFVRVNSLGAKLRASDLALAQITAKWPSSLAKFEKFQKDCNFPLDLSIHLRNLISFATHQSKFKVIKNLSKTDLENAWHNSTQGMEFAINFLKENVGIDSPILLSSPFILITLSYYCHTKNYKLSSKEAQELRSWVLLANIKSRYGKGSIESMIDQDLASIRDRKDLNNLKQLLLSQAGRLEITTDDLQGKKYQSVYFKMMFLAFKNDGAKDGISNLGISLNHIGKPHKLEYHHFFPKKILQQDSISIEENINDICNLMFISKKHNRLIGDKPPNKYLENILKKQGNKEFLSKQCIPIEQNLHEVKKYDDFISRRRKLVAVRLNKLIKQK